MVSYKVMLEKLNSYLESHWLDVVCCRNDDFDEFIINRAGKLLNAIETAMGKTISGRDSDEIVKEFGNKLC